MSKQTEMMAASKKSIAAALVVLEAQLSILTEEHEAQPERFDIVNEVARINTLLLDVIYRCN